MGRMSLAVQARQLKFHVSPYPSSNPFKESNVKVDAESGDRRQKVRYPTSVGGRQKTTTRWGGRWRTGHPGRSPSEAHKRMLTKPPYLILFPKGVGGGRHCMDDACQLMVAGFLTV